MRAKSQTSLALKSCGKELPNNCQNNDIQEKYQTIETMEEEIFSEKCGKKSQVKQGLKYEFGNLSVNSNLGKDDFSGTVSVEARLS